MEHGRLLLFLYVTVFAVLVGLAASRVVSTASSSSTGGGANASIVGDYSSTFGSRIVEHDSGLFVGSHGHTDGTGVVWKISPNYTRQFYATGFPPGSGGGRAFTFDDDGSVQSYFYNGKSYIWAYESDKRFEETYPCGVIRKMFRYDTFVIAMGTFIDMWEKYDGLYRHALSIPLEVVDMHLYGSKLMYVTEDTAAVMDMDTLKTVSHVSGLDGTAKSCLITDAGYVVMVLHDANIELITFDKTTMAILNTNAIVTTSSPSRLTSHPSVMATNGTTLVLRAYVDGTSTSLQYRPYTWNNKLGWVAGQGLASPSESTGLTGDVIVTSTFGTVTGYPEANTVVVRN